MVILALLLGLYAQKRREDQLQATLLLYRDWRTEGVVEIIDQRLALTYADGAPLEQMLKDVKLRSTGRPKLPAGIPIYVDPIGLKESGKSMMATVMRPPHDENLTLREHLSCVLGPLGLGFSVEDGFLMITSRTAVDKRLHPDPYLGYRDVLR